ncbi:hypothetical protein [Oleispirillum naphthae]|uniref:hypothetical protein n=1 Tax=Oleispirillum naphthae TaxID=2838853 RepID=UPI00308257C8
MKRWLIASLAVNVLLIGVGAGFFFTAMAPRLPMLPPVGPRPGIQRDLLQAAETALSGADRTRALAILKRNFQGMEAPPPGPQPRPEDILRAFVEGRLPEDRPFADPNFEERRKREIDALRATFTEMIAALDRPAREAFARAIRTRMDSVRACLDSGPPPRP